MIKEQVNFRQVCENHGYKATTIRMQLFQIFNDMAPVSAGEFIETTARKGFDIVTIYRTLDLFRKIGLTDEYGYGKKRVININNNSKKHYHFIRCSKCKKAIEFKSEIIEKQLEFIAKNEGFVGLRSHFLELTGECSDCTK